METNCSLSNIRALDLTNESGFLCGKILAELGADVIKIEKPGGDLSRNIGPFCNNDVHPEKSLYWFAYNSSKRGITLNIEHRRGQQLLKQLASKSDFILESFPPGYLENLGLSYSELSRINPKIIVTSITPFGQTGPYKDRKATDISLMAMSGLMSLTGYSDRPPVRLSLDQSYCLAGTQAAIGSLFALNSRYLTGKGQQVDVSAYESLVLADHLGPARWVWEKKLMKRTGDRFPRGNGSTKQIWKCKDGYITWTWLGGEKEVKVFKELIQIMDREDMAGSLKSVDWNNVHMSELTDDQMKPWEDTIAAYFSAHTKKDLEQLSLEKNLRLCSINSIADVAKSDHLQSRAYWEDVAYPELGTAITSPGFLFHSSEVQTRVRFRAPLIGEHNNQIYRDFLGLPVKQIDELKQDRII